MNEDDYDAIFELLEQDYDKAIEFALDEACDDDEDTFKKMFKERLRITFIMIGKIMCDRALKEREKQ